MRRCTQGLRCLACLAALASTICTVLLEHLSSNRCLTCTCVPSPRFFTHLQGRARPPLAKLYNWRYRDLGDLPSVTSHPQFLTANPGFALDFQLIDVPDFNGRGESSPLPYFYQVGAVHCTAMGWWLAGCFGWTAFDCFCSPSCIQHTPPLTLACPPLCLPLPPCLPPSLQNLGEAEYLVSVYQYMRLLGYPAHKISVLTTYNGQKALLRDVFERRCAHHPAFGRPAKVGACACCSQEALCWLLGMPGGCRCRDVCLPSEPELGPALPATCSMPPPTACRFCHLLQVTTVDKYQGQQNDYVLLSLVRTNHFGHFRDVRRLGE